MRLFATRILSGEISPQSDLAHEMVKSSYLFLRKKILMHGRKRNAIYVKASKKEDCQNQIRKYVYEED